VSKPSVACRPFVGWHDVFGIELRALVEVGEGMVTDLKRG
jgi:hypothetical protein